MIEEQQTFLEDKLEKTAKQIRKYALLFTSILVLVRGLFLVTIILFSKD
jgi:hypothetical protein